MSAEPRWSSTMNGRSYAVRRNQPVEERHRARERDPRVDEIREAAEGDDEVVERKRRASCGVDVRVRLERRWTGRGGDRGVTVSDR
jgi:hypothetical protein